MIKNTLIIIFVSILGCENSTEGVKVTIYYTSGLASSTVATPCNQFEAEFAPLVDSLVLDDTLLLAELVKKIELLELDPLKGRFDIDARRKIYFNQAAGIQEVCMGYVGGTQVDGKAMKDQEDLFKLINDFLEPGWDNY